MKKLLIAFLALGLTLGFGVAQDDAKQDHSEEQTQDGEMDHDDSHGDMDHSEHNEMSGMGQALNIVLVGEASLTLEPLISSDGTLTLGVKVEPPANLALSATSPSGQEVTLSAVPIMAMDLKEEGSKHSEGEEHSEDETEHGEGHDHAESEDEHDMDSMKANAATTLSFSVGNVEEGVWRFNGTLNGADVSFPMSIYKASTEQTDVYLVLAPSPTLSTRGLAEAFVYAFRNGEVIHNGMMLNRSMAGMQHSTDDEQLTLVHNHFNDVYNDTLGYGPMANQNSLGFAMAGTWDVSITIMGKNEEIVGFDVEVLDD